MKITRIKNVFILIFLFSAININCKQKNDPTPLNISGLLYTNSAGTPIGSYGDVSDDWGFSTTLSPAEINLFNFPDMVDMTNMVEVANPKIFPAYPNPAKSFIGFVGNFGSSGQLTKLKLVIVDPFFNIALRDALPVSGNPVNFFSLTNFAYQKGGIYRIYYSLSAKDKPNYKMGYGDFQICPGYITTPNCP